MAYIRRGTQTLLKLAQYLIKFESGAKECYIMRDILGENPHLDEPSIMKI